MKRFALVTAQETACPETVLTELEFGNEKLRKHVEAQFCQGKPDDPIAGSWVDVSENEACV